MGIRSMLPGEADRPLNAWYVAAHSHEVTREPMKRKLLGRPVVLYRKGDGSPVALFDRCPHRGYPLSNGRLLGDNIQCRYHGLEFDPCGTCAKVPSGDRTPTRMTVDSYPLVESTHWTWFWMGDPAAADPDLVPDETGTYGMGRDGWHHRAGILLPVDANYLLPFENLLDATHISFLHPGQLDAGGVAAEAYDMREEDGRILVSRRIENEEQSPLTMHAFGLKGTHAPRTITAEAFPPNLCGIRVDIEPIDEPGHRATNQLLVASADLLTEHVDELVTVTRLLSDGLQKKPSDLAVSERTLPQPLPIFRLQRAMRIGRRR